MRNVIKWIPLVLYCVLVLALVICTPESIYFSKAPDRVEVDTLILTLVFVIPLVFVPIVYPKRFIYFCFGYIAFGFLGYVSGNYYRNKSAEMELSGESVLVKGVVKNMRYRRGNRGSGYWEFICEFVNKGKVYKTFYQTDRSNRIRNGDTLDILILERNPEISKVVLSQSSK